MLNQYAFFPNFYKPHCVCLQMSLSPFQCLMRRRKHNTKLVYLQTTSASCLISDKAFWSFYKKTTGYIRILQAYSGICRHTLPCAESKHLLRSVGTLAPRMLMSSSHPQQPETLRGNAGRKHQSNMLHHDTSCWIKELEQRSQTTICICLFGLIVYQHKWACLLAAQRNSLGATNCVVFTPI